MPRRRELLILRLARRRTLKLVAAFAQILVGVDSGATVGRSGSEPSAADRPHLATPQGLGAVKSMAWSPDGQRLAAAHDDPSAGGEHAFSLIDASVWRETMRLVDGGSESVDGVALSVDGTIGAGSFNGVARLWDRGGRPSDVLDCGRGAGERGRSAPNGASGVAFSPDGKRVAAICTNGELRLWSVSGSHARPARTSALAVSFSALAFSPDGHTIAWGSWDGLVGVISDDGRRARLLGPHGRSVVQSIGFGAAGTTLVSSSRDGEVRVWDVGSGTLRTALKTESGLAVPAAISPDGKLLVTGGPAGITFWDAATGELLDRHADARGDPAVAALAFRPDGALLAVGGPRGIEIWQVANRRRQVAEIAALGETGTEAVLFTPRGEQLATADVDGLEVWSLSKSVPSAVREETAKGAGSVLDIVVGPGLRSARLAPAPGGGAVHAIDPTGGLSAVAEATGGIAILDHAGTRLRTAAGGVSNALAFSPDGIAIAQAGEDGRIDLIESGTGKRGRAFRSPTGEDTVACLAVSGKGATVAAGTTRGTVEIWDAASGQRTHTVVVSPGYPQAIAFSPDGKWMAVGMSQRGTLLFSFPDLKPTFRLIAVPGRDAAFVESVATGEVHASGADAQRFVVCRAGRLMLPATACDARQR